MGQVARKGKKRAARVRPVDDDLDTLASVLAEYRLDNNAYGWFKPLWRNGAMAARLAAATAHADRVYDGIGRPEEKEAWQLIEYGWTMPGPATYEQAGELYSYFVRSKMNTNTARLLGAALRCMQLQLARSDGGGEVYNEVLIPVFLPIDVDLVASLVLEYRCLDAIGTSHHLQGDRHDRKRDAFRIAWQRGLYHAAYSIPSVTYGS